MISSSDVLHGKILIVDDLETDVRLLKRMLRGGGYVSITSTMDPFEVCEQHHQNHYDLILLDLQISRHGRIPDDEKSERNQNGRLSSSAGEYRPTGSQAARCASSARKISTVDLA